jgi:tetratricopeptide (TPR) repeat protein
VNVQLIDATEDRHRWAEHYDRSLSDLIGLQGELATQIAATLKAKLAPEEKARVQSKVTDNPDAYVLYLRALQREGMVNASREDKIAAEQLYMQATAVAPTFALAFARASLLNSELAVPTGEEDPERQAKARAQVDEALRLAPGLGEAHMALGLCLYWGEKDYFAALKEFSLAAAASPNDADILYYISGIYRRQGRWRESIASLQRAQGLDPRNRRIATFAGNNYLLVHDWGAATACYNRVLEIAPDSAFARMCLAYLEVFRNGTPASGKTILAKAPKSANPNGLIAEARWDFAMLERDFAAAEGILREVALETFPDANGLPKSFFEGRISRARGDTEGAQRCLRAVTSDYENWTSEIPGNPSKHETLGLLYAYSGRKEDAIREARRALEIEPESQNAFHGAARAATLALVYALVGEVDQAIPLIECLLSTPGPAQSPNFPQNITLADLRLRWEWDSLRKDPRFQKILAEPEPKTIYN